MKAEIYSVVDKSFKPASLDKKMNWKPYSNDGKPTFPKDSALYVYARITDNDGNYNYLRYT